MNFETLERTWRKQIVTGANEPMEAATRRMKRDVAVAQRRIRGGIALVTCVLVLGWATTLVAHLTAIKRLTALELIAQGVYLLLGVAFLDRALRSVRAVRNQKAMMGGTYLESTEATLRTVELQIENARIAGYAIPIVVAISVWLFVAKYLAFELPRFGIIAGSAFVLVFGAVIGAIIWHRYCTRLLPRRRELKEMLDSLSQNESKDGDMY